MKTYDDLLKYRREWARRARAAGKDKAYNETHGNSRLMIEYWRWRKQKGYGKSDSVY